MPKSILGVIPARQGSKGVPGKNMRLLCGKPLLQHTLESASQSKLLSDILISTDSEEMLALSQRFGALSNGLRPDFLSGDSVLTIDVIKYELLKMQERGIAYDYIMLLQPTCPLRNSDHIDNAISLLLESSCKSLVSVVDVGANHPLRMKRIVHNKLVNYVDTGIEDMRPRQHLPPVFIRNGAIYLIDSRLLFEENSLVGKECIPFVMSPDYSINIDSLSDLMLAEYFFNAKS